MLIWSQYGILFMLYGPIDLEQMIPNTTAR